MKRIFIIVLICLFSITTYAQETKIKTGWKFGGALPAISFDTDLGFQYGIITEFYNYGDGTNYPEFLEHLYLEASRYTKGSANYRLMFESKSLIPNIGWVCDLSYLPDKASPFYGYNGYKSVFNSDWSNKESDLYRSRMFYRYERNLFRFKNDFQGSISGNNFLWNAGISFQHFGVSSVDIDHLNKGKDSDDMLPQVTDQPGIFERYQALGIIPEKEADGGWVNTIKACVSWDSRDNIPNPMKGVWTEAGFEIAPGFLGNESGFIQFYLTHRQYFTLIEKNLSFVYRIGYQQTLGGHVPFYYQSQMITSRLTKATNEGLGGKSSLRGVLRNRVIGDGIAYANVELRWKPLRFTAFNQDFYIGLDWFYDVGIVTKNIELPDNLQTTFTTLYPTESYYDYFSEDSETFHHTTGVSLMIAMNENFVIAVDVGKAFNKQDGNIGVSIGLNYLF